MILRYVLRLAWVVVAFCIATGVALAVLFALGAMWAGGELRAAAPHDPVIEQGGAAFGAVLFIGTVTPSLTALPGLIAVVIGEVLRARSWIYYVLAGGAALAAVPLLAGAPMASPLLGNT